MTYENNEVDDVNVKRAVDGMSLDNDNVFDDDECYDDDECTCDSVFLPTFGAKYAITHPSLVNEDDDDEEDDGSVDEIVTIVDVVHFFKTDLLIVLAREDGEFVTVDYSNWLKLNVEIINPEIYDECQELIKLTISNSEASIETLEQVIELNYMLSAYEELETVEYGIHDFSLTILRGAALTQKLCLLNMAKQYALITAA